VVGNDATDSLGRVTLLLDLGTSYKIGVLDPYYQTASFIYDPLEDPNPVTVYLLHQ
jgi:hypothetical protein